MSNGTLTKTVILKASPATVWEYLTNKDKLAEWFHAADTHLTEGKDYALLGTQDDGSQSKLCWGSVLKATPPSELVYTFTCSPLNGLLTTVTWQLSEVAGGTCVTLIHEGIPEASGGAALPMLMDFDKGWDEHFTRLRDKAIH